MASSNLVVNVVVLTTSPTSVTLMCYEETDRNILDKITVQMQFTDGCRFILKGEKSQVRNSTMN